MARTLVWRSAYPGDAATTRAAALTAFTCAKPPSMSPRALGSVVTMDHRTPTAATEPDAIAIACQQDRARVAAALEEAARVGMPADVAPYGWRKQSMVPTWSSESGACSLGLEPSA